jgi:hypothetical protein
MDGVSNNQLDKVKRKWIAISVMWIVLTGIYTLASDLSLAERESLGRTNFCHMIVNGGGTATFNCYDHEIKYLFLRWGIVFIPVLAGWGLAAWVSKGKSEVDS